MPSLTTGRCVPQPARYHASLGDAVHATAPVDITAGLRPGQRRDGQGTKAPRTAGTHHSTGAVHLLRCCIYSIQLHDANQRISEYSFRPRAGAICASDRARRPERCAERLSHPSVNLTSPVSDGYARDARRPSRTRPAIAASMPTGPRRCSRSAPARASAQSARSRFRPIRRLGSARCPDG